MEGEGSSPNHGAPIPVASISPRPSIRLCDGEGVPGAQGLVLCALEPALVAHLHLEQVEVALGHGGGDQLVAATLIAIGGTGEHFELVVLLAVLVGGLLHVQDGGGGNLAGGETTLGPGVGAVEGSLVAQQVGVVLQELVGGAQVLDGALAHLLLDDHQVVDGIKVVLIAQDDASEVLLLGGVPLGGEQQSEALAGIGDEACDQRREWVSKWGRWAA